MPDYGMIVRNGSNQAIIDSNYKNLEVAASGRVFPLGSAANKCWLKIENAAMDGSLLFVRASNPAARICSMKRQVTRQYFLCDLVSYLDYLIVRPNAHSSVSQQSGYGLVVFDGNGQEVYSSQKRYARISGVSKAVDSSGNPVTPLAIRNRADLFYGHSLGVAEFLHASFSGFFMVEVGQSHCLLGAPFFRRDPASGRVVVLNELFYRNDVSPSHPFPSQIFEGVTNNGPYYDDIVSDCVLTSLKES